MEVLAISGQTSSEQYVRSYVSGDQELELRQIGNKIHLRDLAKSGSVCIPLSLITLFTKELLPVVRGSSSIKTKDMVTNQTVSSWKIKRKGQLIYVKGSGNWAGRIAVELVAVVPIWTEILRDLSQINRGVSIAELKDQEVKDMPVKNLREALFAPRPQ